MAIEAIRDDLLAGIQSGKIMRTLRDFQYKNMLITIVHDPKRISLTSWNALVMLASNKKDTALLDFLSKKEGPVKRIILNEAEKIFGDYNNVVAQHQKHGYTVHKTTAQMKKASGYAGGKKMSGPRGRHVLIAPRIIGGKDGEEVSPFQGSVQGISCQYAGSLDKRERDAMDKRMNLFLAKNVSKRIMMTSMTKFQSDAGAAKQIVNYDLDKPGPGSKNNLGKLHGPTASNYNGKKTVFKEDTSVPLVGVTERLKELLLDPALLEDMAANTQYHTAITDFVQAMDADFRINQKKISDIVLNQREIEIFMSLGDVSTKSSVAGSMQSEMTHADKANVEKVLKLISNNLISANSDPDYKASTSFVQDYQRIVPGQVIANMIKKDGTPDMRFKANKKLIVQSRKKSNKKTKTDTKQNLKGKSKRRIIKAGAVTAKKAKKSSGIMGMGVAGATTSPIALKELIQAQLAERVLDNMGTPALVNRTGRLRRSAQVQNVMVGPRGGTEVQYTYMKDPYATFEPGGDMGSRNRDPRNLIGGTIREIAMELTGNKFIRTRSL
tara:strand:- start:13285 stop:14943 length:1659 start_codon:yes stop_codon:yes gene_type:complete